MDLKPKFSEISGDIKKAQGLGPEVKGREVINPGVYKNKMRFHKTAETLSKKWMKRTEKGRGLAFRVGDGHEIEGYAPE